MRLAEIAEYSALTEAQQLQYDESLDNYLSYYNTIEYREKKALNRGREEEREKAYQEKIQSAKTLKAGGVSISLIISATGLPEEVVMNLPVTEAYKNLRKPPCWWLFNSFLLYRYENILRVSLLIFS